MSVTFRKYLLTLVVFFLCIFNSQSLAWAADGDLDTSFDTDGKVSTPILSGADEANSVVLQSDGKIVAAGSSYNGSNYDFAVVRYNTDGSLDTTFGTGGKVTTSIGSDSDVANSVVLQSDGKIVAAGYSHNGSNFDFAIVRYNTNGSLDTTFDADGKQTTSIGSGTDGANSAVLQSDGKIVAAGYSHNGTNTDFAVVRYNTDGSLDTTFDTDGKQTTAIGSGAEVANSVVLQGDGKIVAAGYSHNGTNTDFAVVRYNTDGSLDTTFDTDGKQTTSIGSGTEVARSVVLQSDGKIVAAGWMHNGTNEDFAVVRYSANVSDAPGSNDSGSTTASVTTPTIVKTPDVVFNLKNKKYLSKDAMKTKLSKIKSFKRNPKDLYKYSIFGTSKQTCLMRGNNVMALKKTGSCDLYATRTTPKGAKYKYWVKINYVK